jgi:ClpP class serine protease
MTGDRQPAARVLAAILGETWAITPSGYEKLCEIAARENVVTPAVLQRIEQRKEAVAARRGTLLENTRSAVQRGSVAIVNVTGPIIRYADIFAEISGATSIETFALDFTAAIENPTVKTIIGVFDSPGGMVAGVNESAGLIAKARGKGKRLIAYVSVQCASAAYWLASAFDEIVIEETAEAGYIGIIVSARVPAEPREGDPTTIEKVSTQTPRKRLSPKSDEGQKEMQRVADRTADVFLKFVKAHRPEGLNILDGGSAIGADAVECKLADRVGTLEGLIAEAEQPKSGPRGAVAANVNLKKGAKTMERQGSNTKKQAGPGACSECNCPEFKPSEADANICGETDCGHENAKHAEATDAGGEETTALRNAISKLEARLAEADKRAALADIEKKATDANAAVDQWLREGAITGNAETEVRRVYVKACKGETVTAEDIQKMVGAMPRFSTARVAAPPNGTSRPNPGAVSTGHVALDDFTRMASDPAAAQRVNAAVAARQKTDAKFTARDLYRELTGSK